MWLTHRMGAHVHHQARGLGERLGAQLALVWLLSTVDAYVCVEAANVRECLLANGALKRFV